MLEGLLEWDNLGTHMGGGGDLEHIANVMHGWAYRIDFGCHDDVV